MSQIVVYDRRELDELVKKLNGSRNFLRDYFCFDFSCALLYHYFKEPILDCEEKLMSKEKIIDKMVYYFLAQQVFEDEIKKEDIPRLENLSLILQARHNRAVPMHSSNLIYDCSGERSIIEKDGTGPILITPFNKWKNYQDIYPVYASYGRNVVDMLVRDYKEFKTGLVGGRN